LTTDNDAHPKWITDEQLLNWTRHHPPGTYEVIDAHEKIRAAARAMLAVYQTVIPEGFDKIVALRAVQAAMWAGNSAVACNHPDNL
jgi:hypothetical protein